MINPFYSINLIGNWIQIMTFLLCLFQVIASQIWIRQNKLKYRYEVANMSVAIHIMLFYFAFFLRAEGILDLGLSFTNWSIGLRIHQVITTLMYTTYRIDFNTLKHDIVLWGKTAMITAKKDIMVLVKCVRSITKRMH